MQAQCRPRRQLTVPASCATCQLPRECTSGAIASVHRLHAPKSAKVRRLLIPKAHHLHITKSAPLACARVSLLSAMASPQQISCRLAWCRSDQTQGHSVQFASGLSRRQGFACGNVQWFCFLCVSVASAFAGGVCRRRCIAMTHGDITVSRWALAFSSEW